MRTNDGASVMVETTVRKPRLNCYESICLGNVYAKMRSFMVTCMLYFWPNPPIATLEFSGEANIGHVNANFSVFIDRFCRPYKDQFLKKLIMIMI